VSEAAVRRPADGLFNTIVLAAFILVASLGALQHDMWRDEMQAFLIARDSATPWDLVRNLRYDGHPILWYLLIWPGARLTWNPDSMHFVSLPLSAAGVALFLWRGPWSRLEKTLWPFGYYVLFECSIKSRSYGLGAALLIAFCALWRDRDRRMIALAVVMGLMANTHLYFGILAVAGGGAPIADRLCRSGWRGVLAHPARDATAVAVFILLGTVAALIAAPPADGDFARLVPGESTTLAVGLGRAMVGLGQLALPAAVLLGQFGVTESHVITAIQVSIGLSLWLFLLLAVTYLRDPPALVMHGLGAGGILLVFLLSYGGGAQHAGTILLAVTAAQWIAREASPAVSPRVWHQGTPAILASHAVTGLAIVALHTQVPYANSRTAARFIAAQGWATQPIAGIGESLSPVCGYLQLPACYRADRGHWSSYTIYSGAPVDFSRGTAIPPVDEERMAAQVTALGPNVTYVIPDNAPTSEALLTRHGFRKAATLTGAAEDNYRIYRKGN
jgi:hypothetical protein